jgi:hypothetical protein
VQSRDERHRLIARAAYFRSEYRGFAPGYELEDWLWAEREVDTGVGGEAGRHTIPRER